MTTNSKVSSFFTSYFSSSVSLDLDGIIKTPIDDDSISYNDISYLKDYIRSKKTQDKTYDTIYRNGIVVTRYGQNNYYNSPKSIKISLIPQQSSSMKVDAIPSSDFLNGNNPSYEDKSKELTSYTGLIYTNSLKSYYTSEKNKINDNTNYICSLYSSTIEMIQGYERSISYLCAYIESTLNNSNSDTIGLIFNNLTKSKDIPLRIDVETADFKSRFVWRTDSSILYDDIRKKNHTIYTYEYSMVSEDEIANIVYTYSYLSYLNNDQLSYIENKYKKVYFTYLNGELAKWNQIQDVKDPEKITIDYNDWSKYEENYLHAWKAKTNRATIDDLKKSLEKVRKKYDKLALLLNNLIVRSPKFCKNEIENLKNEKH